MKVAAIRSILFALMMMAMGSIASAQFGVQITIAPPALPVYEQPICPGDGYIWTPGYWAYADEGGYYWVPGTWVMAPQVGYLWTPPYWGWGGGYYAFHQGYWGPHVGFYGGVSYGYGYFGNGYEGGRWDGGHFYYNRSVTNVNVTVVKNVYNTTVINRNENRVSYNGGNGGINARPTHEQENYDREHHVGPVAVQEQHINAARSNPEFRASENKGRPPVAATARPNEFKGEGAVPAKSAGGEYHAPENNGHAANNNERPANNANDHPANANEHAANTPAPKPTHAKELTPPNRNTLQPTGNPKTDAKYQQQQQKLAAQQDKQRSQMAAKQEQEDKQAQQRNNQQKQQQVEQKHAQQTQQLQQKHEQQQTHFESHAAPPQQHSNGGNNGGDKKPK